MLTISNDDTLRVTVDRLILRHGALPVLLTFAVRLVRRPRIARPRIARRMSLQMSDHLLRDIGLPPEPDRPPHRLRRRYITGGGATWRQMLAAPRPRG